MEKSLSDAIPLAFLGDFLLKLFCLFFFFKSSELGWKASDVFDSFNAGNKF